MVSQSLKYGKILYVFFLIILVTLTGIVEAKPMHGGGQRGSIGRMPGRFDPSGRPRVNSWKSLNHQNKKRSKKIPPQAFQRQQPVVSPDQQNVPVRQKQQPVSPPAKNQAAPVAIPATEPDAKSTDTPVDPAQVPATKGDQTKRPDVSQKPSLPVP